MKNTFFKTIKTGIWIGSAVVLLAGCDSFTDVELPKSQLTAAAVFEDRITATAAMTDIYSKIRDNGLLTGYPSGLSNQLGLYADELAYYGQPGTSTFNFANNALLPTGGEIAELWNSSYSQVYAANAVIEGLQNAANLPDADRDRLTGEALFVRALLHFYLANTLGYIPYIKTTDYTLNRVAQRMPATQALTLAKEDLERAIALLPETYATAERVRPNKFAAYALLARVYLYLEQWPEASNAASAVLNQSELYIWESDPDKIFLKESTATIWQLMPGMAGDNTREAPTFSFETAPPPISALSAALVGAFEPGDLRKMHWVKTITDGTDSYAHAYKYKQAMNNGSSTEYSIVLRLAEQYLIRAEARARQGDLIGAKEDLNKVRHTAGLEDSEAETVVEVVDAVLRERRVELFCEFGHRFLDLKRSGRLDAALQPLKLGWNPTDASFPLPQGELLLNPNLAPQNEGY